MNRKINKHKYEREWQFGLHSRKETKQLAITAQVLENLTAKAGSRLRSDQWVGANTQWVGQRQKGRQQGTEDRNLLNLGAVMLNLDVQWDFLGSFRTDWWLVLREAAVEAWGRVHCGWDVVNMKGSKKGSTRRDHSELGFDLPQGNKCIHFNHDSVC